jgi:uncharacterized repeat protein (TIGR03803 family)
VLYGVTNSGGKYGYGAIFKITTTGTFSELHNFKGTDGANPAAALTAPNGVLYGTTSAGGAHGDGVVFTLKL